MRKDHFILYEISFSIETHACDTIIHFLYGSNQSGSTVNSILNYQQTLHFCSTTSMGYSTKDRFSKSKLYAFRSKDTAQGYKMMDKDSELNSSHGHNKSTTRYRIISPEIVKNRGTVSTKKGAKEQPQDE